MHSLSASSFVIPAEAGIQDSWTPAFAGVTEENVRSYLRNPVISAQFHKYGLAWRLFSWLFSGAGILPVHEEMTGGKQLTHGSIERCDPPAGVIPAL